ncbi:MAG TPA: GNAT family N-acetyltransferase, partial [Candidatus Limnocylindrales bacterium]|nr:GNAT family N-acetyltransferase [Candidatus Limnocylindrales bacterium]
MSAPFRLRPFDPARDYPAAASLVSAVNEHDGYDWLPTPEILRHEFEHSANFRPAMDARVAEVDRAAAGVVTAEWRARAGKIVHHVELWVAPAHRGRGVGSALLAWAEAHEVDRVRSGDGGPVDLAHEIGGGGDPAIPGSSQLAAKRGYAVVRHWMELRRTLDGPIPDVPLPSGLAVRPVAPDEHRRIWEADVEAFRDHWEASERTEQDFERWFHDP